MVHSKEASHSGKGAPRTKALNENSRGSKNFEEERQGISSERVWREAPGCNARARLANVFEIGSGCNVWKGGEVGLTVIEKASPEGVEMGKKPGEVCAMGDMRVGTFPNPATIRRPLRPINRNKGSTVCGIGGFRVLITNSDGVIRRG